MLGSHLPVPPLPLPPAAPAVLAANQAVHTINNKVLAFQQEYTMHNHFLNVLDVSRVQEHAGFEACRDLTEVRGLPLLQTI